MQEQQNPTACSHLRADKGTLVNAGLTRVISIPAVKQPEDVYTWLLRAFVVHADAVHKNEAGAGQGTRTSAWANPLMLLGRKWKSVDAAEALAMMPDNLLVADLAPYLSTILKGVRLFSLPLCVTA